MVKPNHMFYCLKIGHVNRNYPTKVKAPKIEVNKGKEKFDVEHIMIEMKTWKRRDGSSTSNGGITSPKRSSDHTSSN